MTPQAALEAWWRQSKWHPMVDSPRLYQLASSAWLTAYAQGQQAQLERDVEVARAQCHHGFNACKEHIVAALLRAPDVP